MTDQANKVFVDQSETPVATIGSDYLQNFLSGGKVERGIGVLTQKRFYYKGHNFSGTGKALKSITEKGVVSIEDISFTMFKYSRHVGWLIFGAFLAVIGFYTFLMEFSTVSINGSGASFPVSLIVLAASIPFFVGYFTKRQTLFQISFPGGCFVFDVRYYPISEVRDFQRQLYLMKDHIKENA